MVTYLYDVTTTTTFTISSTTDTSFHRKMASFGRDMLASGCAACIARTAMAPMERVKLLLQLQAVSQQMTKSQQYKVSTL